MKFLLGSLLLVSQLVMAADKPNVLFIVVDDLRPELGAYGHTQIRSPNIDRLARTGVIFERAYCQQADCGPSRASFLTGARPDTTRVWFNSENFRKAMPNVVTLGEHFMRNGYFVQGMGKIFDDGKDDPQSWSVPWQTPPAPLYAKPENLRLHQRQFETTLLDSSGKRVWYRPESRGPAFECADVPDDTFTDGKVADLAVATIKELQKKDQPFFLAVGFARPHLPFVAPKKYWDLYDRSEIELAPNPFRPKNAPAYAVQAGEEIRLYHGVPLGTVPDDVARGLRHGYFASVSYVDAQIGKVLAELDRLDLRQNTVIVLLGDHGWKLGEHDAWGKHTNCENDTNAPLVISGPGISSAGARSRALVEFVDVYPTLCDLAGLSLPAHLEGLSFKPVLKQPGLSWKQAAFSQFPRRNGPRSLTDKDLIGYSMRTERYRFTMWVEPGNIASIQGIELYDHETDPQENMNIAGNPKFAPLVSQLTNRWHGGWKAAGPK